MNQIFKPFEEKLISEAIPDIVIKNFEYYFNRLIEGEGGLIPDNSIEPVENLPDVENFPQSLRETGNKAMKKTILLKLNGGLGTGMGLDRAKSLLKVKNNLTFLDIIASQAMTYKIPLLLMNSFATDEDSLNLLKKYDLQNNIPLSFLQNMVPKINQDDLSPALYFDDPELEWCPPGHGDIYTALITSGILDLLLNEGYLYLFVSNADNLGAVMDTSILGYFAEKEIPFMMEVSDRTEADKKGGHLAVLPDGQFILRELAQCPSEELKSFQDIKKYKYFNTNNLWINLSSLKDLLNEKNNILGLPMICNKKTVNPCDSKSTPVYQLETAMGSAISIFKGSQAVRVPRRRFSPVKSTNDLLALRSDAFILTEDFQIAANPERKAGHVIIELDENYYKMISQLEDRFPFGSPSLLECEKLIVKGDIKFGRNIKLKGNVKILNKRDSQVLLEDNLSIEGDFIIT
jgi:UTP--glucose-1-phosphate uridylyltransferase